MILESGVSSIAEPDTIPALFTIPNQTLIILSEMELNSMVLAAKNCTMIFGPPPWIVEKLRKLSKINFLHMPMGKRSRNLYI